MEQTITIPEGYVLQQTSETEYKIVKIEKEFPNSWEKFCEMNPIKIGESYIRGDSEVYNLETIRERRPDKDRNVLPNKEKAEAILALCQLIQLRDCYNDGWKPDWDNSSEYKYCIFLLHGCWDITLNTTASHIFAFKTQELRDKFLENFKDLLEKVKPLFY